jgi:hypothetical protein
MKLPTFQNQINFQFNVDENNTIGKNYEKHLYHQISNYFFFWSNKMWEILIWNTIAKFIKCPKSFLMFLNIIN